MRLAKEKRSAAEAVLDPTTEKTCEMAPTMEETIQRSGTTYVLSLAPEN